MSEVYDFGIILKNLRTQHGLTQEQLAKKINKENSVISRYEKNLQSPTFETVRAFAMIFNVSMDFLSGMEDTATISTSGLSAKQVEIVKELVLQFKNAKISSKKFTDEQYVLLGKITAEFFS